MAGALVVLYTGHLSQAGPSMPSYILDARTLKVKWTN